MMWKSCSDLSESYKSFSIYGLIYVLWMEVYRSLFLMHILAQFCFNIEELCSL